jgi:hypothetical protein
VKLALVILTVLLAYSSSAVAKPEHGTLSPARAAVPRIHIELFARPDVTDALLTRMCAETDAIWGAAGVTFDWQRARRNDHSSRKHLAVTIDDSRTPVPEPQLALGWITFTPDGPNPSIHLSLATTEDLLRASTTMDALTIAGHEMMVGRALGRALAHEIGHYLLKSRVHASRGLMQRTRPADRFFAVSRRGFEITSQERETVIDRLLTDAFIDGAS